PSAAYSSRSSVALSTSTRTGPSMTWPVLVSTANWGAAAAAAGPVTDPETRAAPLTTSSTVASQANHRPVPDIGRSSAALPSIYLRHLLFGVSRGPTKQASVAALGEQDVDG